MRILHVFRSPVGGLFRHVRDLTKAQAARGHEVGIVCDSGTGGAAAEALLDGLAPDCALGILRMPVSRLPGIGDVAAVRRTIAHAAALRPHIIHCHGAKGGLHGRLAARRLGIPSVYAPHGGSLHYRWSSPAGAAFLSAEAGLARIGSGLHFVCRHERESFDARIGLGNLPHAVIHNGLSPEDFAPATPGPGAADLLFIGDMREIKGVDVLLGALAALNATRRTSACLVGDGPDLPRFRARAQALGLGDAVQFPGRMPAREAFTRGRLLVVPSRAESFPYVVLEAAAAGLPLLASAVGGIPEVLEACCLLPPGEEGALAGRLAAALAEPGKLLAAVELTRERLRRDFAACDMADRILAFYSRFV